MKIDNKYAQKIMCKNKEKRKRMDREIQGIIMVLAWQKEKE
jgi:hypothetical protein